MGEGQEAVNDAQRNEIPQEIREQALNSDDFELACHVLSEQLKTLRYETMLVFHKHSMFADKPMVRTGSVPAAWIAEMKANLMLSFRAQEVAEMRIEKAVGAFKGKF